MTKINFIYIFLIFSILSCSKKHTAKIDENYIDTKADSITDKPLKEKDTIYFYFDYSENLKKGRTYIDTIKRDTFMNYQYYESKKNIYGAKRYIFFFSEKYIPSNKGRKIADIKILSKSFLRKNKGVIIYPDDILGDRLEKFVHYEFKLNKIYYIIDTAEKKGNKFVAREVRYSFGTFVEL